MRNSKRTFLPFRVQKVADEKFSNNQLKKIKLKKFQKIIYENLRKNFKKEKLLNFQTKTAKLTN